MARSSARSRNQRRPKARYRVGAGEVTSTIHSDRRHAANGGSKGHFTGASRTNTAEIVHFSGERSFCVGSGARHQSAPELPEPGRPLGPTRHYPESDAPRTSSLPVMGRPHAGPGATQPVGCRMPTSQSSITASARSARPPGANRRFSPARVGAPLTHFARPGPRHFPDGPGVHTHPPSTCRGLSCDGNEQASLTWVSAPLDDGCTPSSTHASIRGE